MAVTITSSTLTNVSTQRDGRKWVTETHVDSLGVPHTRTYLAEVGFDIQAAMTAYAAGYLAILANGEVNSNITDITTNGSLATVTFKYSTVAQNVAALRIEYKNATQQEAIMIGDFLNSLTDVQIQNAFGLTAGQVTTLRTNKLTPAATTATAIRNAAGQ